jgi:hypothetical protein
MEPVPLSSGISPLRRAQIILHVKETRNVEEVISIGRRKSA